MLEYFSQQYIKKVQDALGDRYITRAEAIHLLDRLGVQRMDGYYYDDGTLRVVFPRIQVDKALDDPRNREYCRQLLDKMRDVPSYDEIHKSLTTTHLPDKGQQVNMGYKRFKYDSRPESEELLKQDGAYYDIDDELEEL